MTDKKVLTRDEEANEIIRRLKGTPRRLSATWIIDPIMDLTTQHGSAVEEEITKALMVSIAKEIDRELFINYGQGKSRAR